MNKPKVYVAARAKYRADEVEEIQKRLSESGYEAISDWTAVVKKIKRPYRDSQNRKANVRLQAQMLQNAKTADVFILLDDEGLRGAYVELGAFLTDCLDSSQNRRAYIVGPNSHTREFVFESPEYVKFCDDIEEVYKDLQS